MSCGKDENVLTFAVALPGLGIVVHYLEIKGRHHVGDAHRSARVTGLRGRDHPYDVPADLGGDFS